MSRLKVMLRGAVISQIELNPDKEYIGGRKDSSDIRLQAEKGISREHFKLKYTDGHWHVTTISRFGDIFSLGQKIESAELQHGQTFQIPPYEFIFSEVPEAGMSSIEQAKAAMAFSENEKTVLGPTPQIPYIKMINSKGEVIEMLRLEVGQVWVAGRDPSCQIIIPDQRVSRRQFEVYKVNSIYTILDLGSANGTFLNGTPVSSTDPQTLKSGDAISVLDNTMYFELHDPNFKYKVDKLDISPLQIEQVDESLGFDPLYGGRQGRKELGELPEVEQHDVRQQLSTSGSPFTGMPGQAGTGGDQFNQYYNFEGAPQEPPKSSLQKLMQNKPLLAIIILVIVGGVFYLSEMSDTSNEVTPVAIKDDPFSRLTPEQQKEVEEYYKLAEQMYNQQKYDLALEKIRKIKELLPGGYKDSASIEDAANSATMTLLQAQEDERIRKEKEEQDIKNKSNIEICKKLMGPKVTKAEMSECLAPVAALDPQNVDYIRLMAEVDAIEENRLQKEREAKIYEQQVSELAKLFTEAEAIQGQGLAFKAIKKYQLVVKSEFPDPRKLKKRSQERIVYIEQKIKEKSSSSLSTAEDLFKAENIKGAISVLREAKIYDPENKNIQEKIDIFSLELKRRVRSLYQEAIIDENYGIVDNTETRIGAKEKWKKITEMDLDDGEYFRKAVIKLHRYGVM